jgi:hypothetical protein
VVSFTPQSLYSQEKNLRYPLDRRLGGGGRAAMDTVVKRKIPSPRRESKPTTPIVKSIAQRYNN